MTGEFLATIQRLAILMVLCAVLLVLAGIVTELSMILHLLTRLSAC
jgi:hypothetical protein